VIVIGLIEKDVFAVISVYCKVLEHSIGVDPVFLAQLLPELEPDYC
jgi:hypothetical protein